MKQVIIFHTGETTCSEKPSYPGSMCPFVRQTYFGADHFCGLFVAPLDDVGGWLQRLDACKREFTGAAVASEVISGGAK